ncbi:MAG: prenyltransferase/squalene oxidase repeat-containing protein, partial [Planctomycetota bacterium]
LKTYRTALTITALTAIDKVKYADAIRRGHEYLTSSQFSEDNGLEELGSDSPYYGGWGYGKAGVKADSDMSNTQFTIEALKETGLEVDPKVWARAAVFLQRCQANTETNDVPTERVKIRNDGGFMYDPALDEGKSVPIERPDGKIEIPSYASMTYAGLMSFLYADIDRKDSRVQAAWNWIGEHYTLSENYGLGTRANPRAAKQRRAALVGGRPGAGHQLQPARPRPRLPLDPRDRNRDSRGVAEDGL